MIKTNKVLSYALLIGCSILLMSNRGGSPGGRTGSSTDGSTCGTNGGCHTSGSAPESQEMISSNIPSIGYSPGESYIVVINASKGTRDVYGFEMMAEDMNGDGIGSFIGDSLVTANGFRVTHKFASSTGSDGITWNAEWVAPEAGTGEVKFYIAVNATNNNFNTTGDIILIDTFTVNENLKASTNKLLTSQLKLYPNPVINKIQIDGYAARNAKINIFNDLGELVLETNFSNVVDVNHLGSGKYYLKIIEGNNVISKSFIKLD